jgi:2-polyprenyl-3-methyl-5-hydroxy-6-metoxy-1,4-benzoquinol methylase
MRFLRERYREPELMDEEGVDAAQLDAALRFIRRINKYLGYTRATVDHLDRFVSAVPSGAPLRLLDVATGSADVPRAILRHADRRGWDVRVTALDRHRLTIQLARAAAPPDPRLTLVQGDALNLPFVDGAFDYALCSMFLHHLAEAQAVRAMAEMARVARRGIIVADLERDWRAYCWITLFTLVGNRMLRHDARVSVAQAFNKPEMLALRDRAGLNFATYHRHFGHRFVLAGEKPS